MKAYVWQVLIALDQLMNTLIAGHADETLSARAYRADLTGKIWGRLMRPLIDGLFLVLLREKNHCRNSFWAEQYRTQLPTAYREPT